MLCKIRSTDLANNLNIQVPFKKFEQSSLQQVPRVGSPCTICFARSSCSAENVCTLASLGISLPSQGTAYKAKGQEIKRLPRASEARPALLRPLKINLLDSQGLFYFMPLYHSAEFLQRVGLTSQSPCVLSSHQLTLNDQMVQMAWQ